VKATAVNVHKSLRALADPELAQHQSTFFKTGPGEYGESDLFLGMRVPQVRAIALQYADLPDAAIIELLHSRFHEDRFCALAIMTRRFRSTRDSATREHLWSMYIKALDDGCVNNWDLVDSTAPHLGEFLIGRNDADLIITHLVDNSDLWHQRVGVMVTWVFIRQGDFDPTFTTAERLMGHPHDLIHKACGWMLREVGKRDIDALRQFLTVHATEMPRTMLRYAIEKMSPAERARWLSH
jgi:3-methyladenine DNA glycosylase AlkD